MDTYEQAIYLYVFRHGRFTGIEETVIGFKSARSRMACGIGEKAKPMSESTAQKKLQSLSAKGCIQIIDSERKGRRIRLLLPEEIPGIIPEKSNLPTVPLEELDFFTDPDNRTLILNRENNKCFYCCRAINSENYVVEHVISRPEGDNGYKNVVAACCQCNNRKGSSSAADFLRTLYREAFLNSSELEERISHLESLQNGELKPGLLPT